MSHASNYLISCYYQAYKLGTGWKEWIWAVFHWNTIQISLICHYLTVQQHVHSLFKANRSY